MTAFFKDIGGWIGAIGAVILIFAPAIIAAVMILYGIVVSIGQLLG